MRQAYDYWQDQPGISPKSFDSEACREAGRHHLDSERFFSFVFLAPLGAPVNQRISDVHCRFRLKSEKLSHGQQSPPRHNNSFQSGRYSTKTCYYPRCCNAQETHHQSARESRKKLASHPGRRKNLESPPVCSKQLHAAISIFQPTALHRPPLRVEFKTHQLPRQKEKSQCAPLM